MQTTRAICLTRFGRPEVLTWDTIPLPPPADDEVQIRNRAVGVNLIDIYHRTGLYPVAIPSGLGQEGAGEVVALGRNATEFAVGDRVVYLSPKLGSYSEAINVPADRVVRLPDRLSFETAAEIGQRFPLAKAAKAHEALASRQTVASTILLP